jgi:multidrug resistance protein, MATE family
LFAAAEGALVQPPGIAALKRRLQGFLFDAQRMNDSAEQLPDTQAPRRPLVELLLLGGPTVAQMASYTLMQFIDTLMLARVGRGVLEPTAASNAGVLAFSFISLGFGTLMVVNTLVSQSFGRKDFESCGRYLWQGVWFALGYALLLLPIVPLVPAVFKWAGHDPALAGLESLYLRIVLAGAVLKLVGLAFSQFLLAIDRPGVGVGVRGD